jgi:hypothetical protein
MKADRKNDIFSVIRFPGNSSGMNNKILSTFLTFFGVILSLTAMIIIALSVAYELRDSAKLMLKGTGYNET